MRAAKISAVAFGCLFLFAFTFAFAFNPPQGGSSGSSSSTAKHAVKITGSATSGADGDGTTGALAASTWHTVSDWDTEVFDEGGLWDAGTPGTITIQRTGTYLVGFAANFPTGNGVGDRLIQFLKNGAALDSRYESAEAADTVNTEMTHLSLVSLTAGDALTMRVYHTDTNAGMEFAYLNSYVWVQEIR